jgi:hypothetical protein
LAFEKSVSGARFLYSPLSPPKGTYNITVIK